MWGYVLVLLGAIASIAGLAVTGLGLPIVLLGGLALIGGVAVLLSARVATEVDDNPNSGKPSWMRKRWFE
jgi:hypothetical protein